MSQSGTLASPKRGEEVVRHMSKRRKDWGLMITRQSEKFGVWTISRIFADHLTVNMFALVDTEEQAREVANREWVGMKL